MNLPPQTRHHLRKVLRLADGVEVLLFNGRGGEARVRLEDDGARVLDATCVPPAGLQLCLIQGSPKGEKLELILQKGTELGVARFVLAEMERSVARIKASRQGARQERWEKIVQEAGRQCGALYLPEIRIESCLPDALETVDAEVRLLLWEQAEAPLQSMLPSNVPESIAVIVGPEGGISGAEAELAQRKGYVPVRLGPRILRTETAGLAIMSILQYLYGDLATAQAGSFAGFKERMSHEVP